MPRHCGGKSADEAADDLADGKEHAVEAHDRPAIAREALGDVRQQAERRRRRAGQHEQPERRRERSGNRHDERQPGAMVDRDAAGHQDAATDDAVQDDRGSSEALEPVAPVEQPGPEQDADDDRSQRDLERREAAVKELIGERRVGLRELEDRLAEPEPDRGVDRDPGRGKEPDVGGPKERPVAARGPSRDARWVAAAARSSRSRSSTPNR